MGSVEIAGQYLDQLLRAFVIVIAESNLGHRLQTLDLTEQAEDEYESSRGSFRCSAHKL